MTFAYSLPINSTTRDVTKLPERLNEKVYRDAPESEEPGSEEPWRDNRRVYYFTIPIDCLSPNPTSLVGLAEMQEKKRMENPKTYNIFVIFATLLRMIEEKMYTRGTSDCGMANPKAGEGMRLFMEYLVDKDVVGEINGLGHVHDVQLLECIGVRFALVVFGDQYDLTHAFEKHFKAIKKRKGPSKKPPNEGTILWCGANEIKSWSMYKSFARAYLGTTIGDDTDEQPASGSQLSVDKLFSLQMAEEVAECSAPGAEITQLQKEKVFGIPKLSYEISVRLASRMVLLYAVLPRMQHFKELSAQELPQVDGFLSAMRDPSSTAASTLLQNRAQANKKYNDLADIKELLTKRKKRVFAIADLKLRATKLEQLQRVATRLHQRIFSEAAAISKPSQRIAAYVKELKTWSAESSERTAVDCWLTSFGNMIADDFLDLEFAMGVSTTHSIVHMALVCAFNAHQYQLGELHLNLLLLGKGSTGKSFILNIVEKLLMKEVATKITNRTVKALTTGEDCNDHISLYHEANFNDGRQIGAETGHAILKDALTSGTVETQSIDGRRMQRNYKSERSGVVIAASNECENGMSHSMHTRFICVPVNEYERKNQTVVDKKRGSITFDVKRRSSQKEQQTRFENRIRRRLCMVHMVERLIATGTIEEPDLSIVKLGVEKSMDYIKEELYPGIQYNQRDYDFVVTYARTLTLMHACERYANDDESPGRDLDFTFKNLLFPPDGGRGIMRYMICTQEIAVYSLSVFFKQLIRYSTIHVTELLLFAFGRETVSRKLKVSSDGKSYESQRTFITSKEIYDCVEDAQRSRRTDAQRSRRTVAEVLSRENIMVAWDTLLSTVKDLDNAPAVKWNTQNGSVTFSKAFVDENFKFESGDYKPKNTLLDIFKKVVDKGFSHKYLRSTQNAITNFPLSREKPFILNTMLICRGKKKSLQLSDPYFDMRTAMQSDGTPASDLLAGGHLQVNGDIMLKSMGDRVRRCRALTEVRADLQDLIYNCRELGARADAQNVPEDEVVLLAPDDDNGDNNNNSRSSSSSRSNSSRSNSNNDGEENNIGLMDLENDGPVFEDSREHLDKVHLRAGTSVLLGLDSISARHHYPKALKTMHDKAYDSKVFKKRRLE